MVILLKQNSLEIRKKIEEAGIRVCICAGFEDAVWLDYNVGLNAFYAVHGIGYHDYDETLEGNLAFYEYEIKKYGMTVIECKDVDEFITKIKEYK